MKIYNISNELTIEPWNRGIRLINTADSRLSTVSDLCRQPFDVFFLGSDFRHQKVNRASAEFCGFNAEEDAVGKTAHDFAEKHSADYIEAINKQALKANKLSMNEYVFRRKDGEIHLCFDLRFPWFDENDQVIGLLGFGIAVGKHSLAESLAYITSLGLLDKDHGLFVASQGGSNSKDIEHHFSKREMEVVNLSVKGKTAKEIGRILGLSYRTVQHYLENIKYKMQVSSKSQLIEKVLENCPGIFK